MTLNKLDKFMDIVPLVSMLNNGIKIVYKVKIDVNKILNKKKIITPNTRKYTLNSHSYKHYICRMIPGLNIYIYLKSQRLNRSAVREEQVKAIKAFAQDVENVLNGIEALKNDFSQSNIIELNENLIKLRKKIFNPPESLLKDLLEINSFLHYSSTSSNCLASFDKLIPCLEIYLKKERLSLQNKILVCLSDELVKNLNLLKAKADSVNLD